MFSSILGFGDLIMSKQKMITLQEVENLEISDIKKIYKKNISKTQTELFSRFRFGDDLIKKAVGCYLYTSKNRKILDATGGIGVLNHGHNHPRILKARERFARKQNMEVHKSFHSPYLAALSANVCKILPKPLTHSYFPNSGAESVESAMKMAYKYHDGTRNFILHSDISFHGKLFGSGSITGSSEINFNFPRIPNTDTFKYNDLDDFVKVIEAHFTKKSGCDIYAVIVEPFNVSSMKACSSEFLLGLRKICTKFGIVLIFDEVYSGWCKTGNLFYFMNTEKLVPDILCYAKSFGGGKASIAGLTARKEIYQKAYDNRNDVMLQSTTYYGFGEETITAIESINIIVEDSYVEKSQKIGALFEKSLNHLMQEFPNHIEEVRGAGALWGIKFKPINSEELLNKMIRLTPFKNEKGLLQKLQVASIIDYCYTEFSVLLFMSTNQDVLLKISLPMIAAEAEVEKIEKALRGALNTDPTKLLLKFIRNNYLGPSNG
jgi:putrescine aminotransferase